jgi:F0F1-type ATP synthase membrane subunit b/b'
MDPTLIVLVSFVIFSGIAYRLGYKQAMAALDGKISNIRKALDDASKAKQSAMQALNDERRRHEEILEEIETITKRTEEQTLTLRQQTLQDINTMINSRQQAAENMIARAHEAAIQSVQEEATAKTIATFEAIVTQKFTATQQKALNDMAIAQIANQLTKSRTTHATKAKRSKSKRSAVK